VANHGCDHLTIKLAEYFEQNLIGWIEPWFRKLHIFERWLIFNYSNIF
jgi:hypothetical protein